MRMLDNFAFSRILTKAQEISKNYVVEWGIGRTFARMILFKTDQKCEIVIHGLFLCPENGTLSGGMFLA